MPTDASYTIADLARLAGLNVRTIRYYLAQGLIPASGESGPGAHYTQGHLDRLVLTRRLQSQHLPLAEIRGRLEQLSDADVAELVASSEAASEAPRTSALDYVRALLGSERGGGQATVAPLGPPPAPGNSDVAVPFAPPLAASPSTAPWAAEQPSAAAVAESPAPYAAAAPRGDAPAPGMALLRRRIAMPRARDLPTEVRQSDGMRAVLDEPAPPAAPTGSRVPDVPNPERSHWERLSLGPNIELHVRRPLSRIEQRRVERLITIARQVLRDDRA